MGVPHHGDERSMVASTYHLASETQAAAAQKRIPESVEFRGSTPTSTCWLETCASLAGNQRTLSDHSLAHRQRQFQAREATRKPANVAMKEAKRSTSAQRQGCEVGIGQAERTPRK
jgi:hypothetical protein